MQTHDEVTPCGTLGVPFVPVIDLCRQWATDVLETVEGLDDVYNTNLDEVENRSRDGFVPFTDGGFNGIGYAAMSQSWGSGSAPAAIQPYIDSAEKEAEEAWDEANPDCTVAMIYATPEPVALEQAGQLVLPAMFKQKDDWQRRQHPRLDEWHEFETNWMQEGGTYFYKVRMLFHGEHHRSESGEPEAYFMVGINTDFEYGRDYIPWLTAYGSDPHCTKWLWEKTVKVADLTPELITQMTKEAEDALRSA